MDKYYLYGELDGLSDSTSYCFKGRIRNYIEYICLRRVDKSDSAATKAEVYFLNKLSGASNIVKFHGWYETSKHYWIILELCSGDTIYRCLSQSGALPEESIGMIAADVLRGLAICHANGVLLASLNPKHICLDSYGVAKLCGFRQAYRVSTLIDGSEAGRRTQGELDRLAQVAVAGGQLGDDSPPECLPGAHPQDASINKDGSSQALVYGIASDLWRVGLLLYKLLAGRGFNLPASRTGDDGAAVPLEQYCELYSARPWRLGRRSSYHRTAVLPQGCALILRNRHLVSLLDGLLAPHPLDRPTWTEVAAHPYCRYVHRTAVIRARQTVPPAEGADNDDDDQYIDVLGLLPEGGAHASEIPECMSEWSRLGIPRVFELRAPDDTSRRNRGLQSDADSGGLPGWEAGDDYVNSARGRAGEQVDLSTTVGSIGGGEFPGDDLPSALVDSAGTAHGESYRGHSREQGASERPSRPVSTEAGHESGVDGMLNDSPRHAKRRIHSSQAQPSRDTEENMSGPLDESELFSDHPQKDRGVEGAGSDERSYNEPTRHENIDRPDAVADTVLRIARLGCNLDTSDALQRLRDFQASSSETPVDYPRPRVIQSALEKLALTTDWMAMAMFPIDSVAAPATPPPVVFLANLARCVPNWETPGGGRTDEDLAAALLVEVAIPSSKDLGIRPVAAGGYLRMPWRDGDSSTSGLGDSGPSPRRRQPDTRRDMLRGIAKATVEQLAIVAGARTSRSGFQADGRDQAVAARRLCGVLCHCAALASGVTKALRPEAQGVGDIPVVFDHGAAAEISNDVMGSVLPRACLEVLVVAVKARRALQDSNTLQLLDSCSTFAAALLASALRNATAVPEQSLAPMGTHSEAYRSEERRMIGARLLQALRSASTGHEVEGEGKGKPRLDQHIIDTRTACQAACGYALSEAVFYCAAQLDDDLERRRNAGAGDDSALGGEIPSRWELPQWVADWLVSAYASGLVAGSNPVQQCLCNVLSQTEAVRDRLCYDDGFLEKLSQSLISSSPVATMGAVVSQHDRALLLVLRARLAMGATLSDDGVATIAGHLLVALRASASIHADSASQVEIGYVTGAILQLAELAQPADAVQRWALVLPPQITGPRHYHARARNSLDLSVLGGILQSCARGIRGRYSGKVFEISAYLGSPMSPGVRRRRLRPASALVKGAEKDPLSAHADAPLHATEMECHVLCRVVAACGSALQAACLARSSTIRVECAADLASVSFGTSCAQLIEIAKATLAHAGDAATSAAKYLHTAASPGSRLGPSAVEELEVIHDASIQFAETAKLLSLSLGGLLKHLEALVALLLCEHAIGLHDWSLPSPRAVGEIEADPEASFSQSSGIKSILSIAKGCPLLLKAVLSRYKQPSEFSVCPALGINRTADAVSNHPAVDVPILCICAAKAIESPDSLSAETLELADAVMSCVLEQLLHASKVPSPSVTRQAQTLAIAYGGIAMMRALGSSVQAASTAALSAAKAPVGISYLAVATQLFLYSLRAFLSAAVGMDGVARATRSLAVEVLAHESLRYAGFGTIRFYPGDLAAASGAGTGVDSDASGADPVHSLALEDCAAEALRFWTSTYYDVASGTVPSASDCVDADSESPVLVAGALTVMLHSAIERLLDCDVEAGGGVIGVSDQGPVMRSVERCCGLLRQGAQILRSHDATEPATAHGLNELREGCTIGCALVARAVNDLLQEAKDGNSSEADTAIAKAASSVLVGLQACTQSDGIMPTNTVNVSCIALHILRAIERHGLVARMCAGDVAAMLTTACETVEIISTSTGQRDETYASPASHFGKTVLLSAVLSCIASAVTTYLFPGSASKRLDLSCSSCIDTVGGKSDDLRGASGALLSALSARGSSKSSGMPRTMTRLERVSRGL